jgi:hypothetical protein
MSGQNGPPFLAGARGFQVLSNSLYHLQSGGGSAMNISGKLPPWVKLISIAVTGLAGILGPAIWSFPLDSAVRDIGIALLAAAILAFTIDRWLKGDIAKDVFFATLGYILPDEFRQEIGRIIGFKLLCERHYMHVKITKIDDEHVRVTVTTERTLKNISSDPQPIRAFSHIDEWGFAQRSRIEICRLELPDGTVIQPELPKKYDWTIEQSTPFRTIQPGQSAKSETKFSVSEVRRVNDQMIASYTAPTKNPEMQLDVPEEIICQGGFGSEEPVDRLAMNRQVLRGMYFPPAHMRLRWYPRDLPQPEP